MSTGRGGAGKDRADGGAEPLFLLGPARGGTSLVYKSLCLHPDVTWISNYVARVPRVPELAVLNRVARRAPGRQNDAWFNGGSNAYVYGERRSWSRRLLPAPVEGEPLFGAAGIARHPAPGAVSTEQALRLRRAVGRLRAADGGRVLVSKRIANNRRVPLLLAAFPGARFLRLVRDGRAVALSLSKVDWWLDDLLPWAGSTPREWQDAGGDPWEVCARNWVEDLQAMDAGLAGVAPERVLSVRYEDVVADPHGSIEAIAAFGGLRTSSDWTARLAGLSYPAGTDGWRRAFPPGALDVVERVQGPELERQGYALVRDSR